MRAFAIALLLVVAFLVGVFVALWLGHRHRPPMDDCPPGVEHPIPATLTEAELPKFLQPRLVGTPASLDTRAPPDEAPRAVVWVNGVDETLVHLDSLRARLNHDTLIITIDLETDQTGRAPVIVRYALAQDPNAPAGLVAVGDELAHGHPTLVARWGTVVQHAIWSALVRLGSDHATQRGGVAGSITIDRGAIHLQPRQPITLISEAVHS